MIARSGIRDRLGGHAVFLEVDDDVNHFLARRTEPVHEPDDDPADDASDQPGANDPPDR